MGGGGVGGRVRGRGKRRKQCITVHNPVAVHIKK